MNPNCGINAATRSIQIYTILGAKLAFSVNLATWFKVDHHDISRAPTLPGSLYDMSGVPAPAHAAQIVPNAAKVEEGVDVVHPGPGSGLLVSHRVSNLVLLPPQSRQRIISLHTPPHVPPRVCGSRHLSISMSQGVHDFSQKLAMNYNNASLRRN
ncbi:hypothetical protein KC19_8G077400 [Ceratodon purpureus]|uniref:Uncharacterized protein n=1 Tax=Ceratodon purpureus TaxID=3225 RepID=A0A8T0GW96_CERPU|nr:hypothetical protein KC19_8G077400 [Ceratodon purpureus]